jgi:hypothetical protein
MTDLSMKLAVPEDWRPFDDVYRAFVEANPMLGLGASEHASTRLRHQYGARLLAAGAALRLPNRRWLASPRRFGPALIAAMAQRCNEIVNRAPPPNGNAPAADDDDDGSDDAS